jgi:beta-lactamase regulating signal transducer with metallopeptidase domain
MIVGSLPALIDLAAAAFVNALPQGLAVAAFSWAVLRVLPRRNARTRFAVWFVALLAIAVLTIVPGSSAGHFVATRVKPQMTLPNSWAAVIVALWAVIATLALSRIALGLGHLVKLRRTCTPLSEEELAPLLRNLVAETHGHRTIKFCKSAAIRVPTAIGLFKPIVAIPDWALHELSAEELNVIFLHEIAHIQRRDDWTNLAQKIVGALFFFHPAVWWIERKLSLEREIACDEVVLAQTRNPHAYAQCLVTLAERSFIHRGVAMAMAAIGRMRDTSVRIAQILDRKQPVVTRVSTPALALVGMFSLAWVGLLPTMPRLVSFSDVQNATNFIAGETEPVASRQLVVPASVRLSHSGPQKQSNTHRAMNSPARHRSPEAPAVIARELQRKPASPVVVNANARRSTGARPQMIMVIQTTQYDMNGTPLWSVRVWQLTWVNSKSVSGDLAAKAI